MIVTDNGRYDVSWRLQDQCTSMKKDIFGLRAEEGDHYR